MQNSQGNVSLDNNVLPCKLFYFACLKLAGKFPGGEERAGRERSIWAWLKPYLTSKGSTEMTAFFISSLSALKKDFLCLKIVTLVFHTEHTK